MCLIVFDFDLYTYNKTLQDRRLELLKYNFSAGFRLWKLMCHDRRSLKNNGSTLVTCSTSISDLGIIQRFKCHPYAILLDKHKEI